MAQQCTRKIQVRADSAYCVGQACEGLFPGTVAAPSPAIVSTGTGTTGGSLGGGYMWAPRHSFVTFDFLGKLYVISGVESHESDETASTADFRHDVWSSQVYIYIYTHARARTHTHTHTHSFSRTTSRANTGLLAHDDTRSCAGWRFMDASDGSNSMGSDRNAARAARGRRGYPPVDHVRVGGVFRLQVLLQRVGKP